MNATDLVREQVDSAWIALSDITTDLTNETANWQPGNFLTSHITSHVGEISTVKGLQGLRGYSF